MNSRYSYFFIVICILQVFFCNAVYAQLSSCENADFEQNSFLNWSGTTGTCCPINSTVPGIVPGRHTIMTGPGTDPNTNGAVTVVAPGGLFSARLGNDNIGAEAEQLSYQISVDPSNALFIYRYAVVLEDPNHTPQEQPRFEIRVYDQNGVAVGCGTYDVYATAGIPGFVTIINSMGSTIHYKDWTTVGIDLSPYIGSTVTIEFSTGDCSLGGHFGYAYVDCYCSPLQILTDFCSGSNSTTLTAPVGFAAYLWNTGETTQSITVQNAVVGTQYQCTMTAVTGCTVTLTSILAPTVIASSYGQVGLCQNSAHFYDSSVVVTGTPINQWLWDFGDGNSSSIQNPVHSYVNAGNYNVSLIVTNFGGCSDTILQTITVNPIPLPAFVSTSDCAGALTVFTDGSSSTNGPVTNWVWDFGDGSTPDTVQHPAHAFASPGTYWVQLIITDSIGCKDTLLQGATTLASPVSDFTYQSACVSSQISFTDATVATGTTITNWEWNFGDGSPLVTGVANPTHGYPGSGSYNVTLVITAASGCTDTIVKPVAVQSIPSAAFSSVPACSNQLVQFADLSTTAAGTISAWSWDFNDGTPISNLQHPVHTFAGTGNYSVQLIVTGSNGCGDTIVQQVIVSPSPAAAFSTNAVCPGATTTFADLSVFPSGTITGWWWDFGDGSAPVTGNAPQHIFAASGSYTVTLVVNGSNGCSDSLMQTVTTNPVPVAAYFIPSGCANTSIFFPNLSSVSSGSIASYLWDFGDGTTTVTASSPSHQFSAGGTYFVTLTATTTSGCTASIQNEVTIQSPPVAGFTVPSVCPGDSSRFSDNSNPVNGSVVDWTWDFGDGSPVVYGEQFPVHLYAGAGPYFVTLIAMNSAGCFDTVTAQASINLLPVASFNAIGPFCQNAGIALSNTSTLSGGAITSAQWQFGNGSSGSSWAPVVNYPLPGTYQITLTVTGDNGCIDSVFHPVVILPLPMASFAVSTICVNESFQFVDSSVSSTPVNTWNWSFGDGTQSGISSPVHSYSNAGNFVVYLQVTNADGCKGDTTHNITVYPLPQAVFSAVNQCPGIPVPFTDQSTIAPGHNITGWEWDFGDSSPLDTSRYPSHAYQTSGTYTISMIAISSMGCTDTATGTIAVYPLPHPAFTADTVCYGEPSSFTNSSNITAGTIAAYNWNFGDNTTGNAVNPQHSYSSAGEFPVQLIATSDMGCIDSVSGKVRVWRLPQPDFMAVITEGCEPLTVSFTDLSVPGDGPITAWNWTFGNGEIDSVANPSLIYLHAGIFDVGLQVVSSYGCKNDTTTKDYITVFPNPVAAFTYDPAEPSVFVPIVNFYDKSWLASQWFWNFGDSSSVNGIEFPAHQYATPGSYTVTLIVESEDGCRDTTYRIIDVKDDYAIWIPNAFTPNNDGNNDSFTVQGFGFTNYIMSIFNRWGEQIYQTKDVSNGWDGTFSGHPAVMDVYVYKVDIKDVFGKPHSYSGRVTLVR